MKQFMKKIAIVMMSVMVLAGAAGGIKKVMAQEVIRPELTMVETVKDVESKQIKISTQESIGLGEVYGVMGGMVVIGAIVEICCVNYILKKKD